MNTWILPQRLLNSSARLMILLSPTLPLPPHNIPMSFDRRGAWEVWQCLHELHDNFNPTTIQKSSKAHGAFNKHQNTQEHSILYLYQNSPEYVKEELRQSRDDISAEIDYSTFEIKHPWYACSGNKKSLKQRKEDYCIDLLCTKMSSFLGEPDTAPPCQVIHFEALDGNVDAFIIFFTAMREENGGLICQDPPFLPLQV